MRVECADPQNAGEIEIRIEGLEREEVFFHITDSHVVAADERDSLALEIEEKYRTLFQERTPDERTPRQLLQAALAESQQAEAACAVLTGDIVHFPSAAALDLLREELAPLQGRYLYALGNHDWSFPYLPWNDQVRAEHYPLFADLMGGNPACQARQIGGVRLVVLDNSNYQVTEEQLEFARAQLEAGGPCLLFMHIPLFLPSLAPSLMERWAAPIAMAAEGWTEETRAKWKVRETDASTLRLQKLLVEDAAAESLAGIFCGHVHYARADAFRPGRYQWITKPCFEGGRRRIRLRPL